MKIYVEHYRIPDIYLQAFALSGPPNKLVLERYMRGIGWKSISGHPLMNVAEPSTRGGMTIARVQIGDETFIGEAFCSMSDNFNYAYGRELAILRLSKEVNRRCTLDEYTEFIDTVIKIGVPSILSPLL